MSFSIYGCMDFPGSSAGKQSTCNAGDLGLMPALGWEDPLEEETATYSSILAWRIPWGHRAAHNQVTFTFTSITENRCRD